MRRLWQVLTTRGQAFVTAGAVLLVAGLLTGVLDLTRLGVLVVVLPLAAAFLARRHDLALTLSRTATPSRLQPDEPCQVELRLANTTSRRSPLLMAEELVDYTLGDRPRFVVPAMSPGQERVVRYTVRSQSRGRHRLGPVGIRVKDPFGLSSRTAAHRASSSILVLPRVHPLPSGGPRGAELGTEGTIPHRVALHGEDDAAIREYRDGDDLRRIHWPATARTGELMVRQEDLPARRRAVLLLDTRSSALPATDPRSGLEWAVSAAASIAVHLLDLGYTMHVLTADNTNSSGVVEAEGHDAILDLLAEVGQCSDADFLAAERRAAALTQGGGLVVAVLGALDDDQARSVASLRRPGGHGIALVVADSGRAPRDADVSRTAAILTDSGWAAMACTSRDNVGQVWASVVGASSQGVPR
jgi:uncharacterized protein (DUF58 family)